MTQFYRLLATPPLTIALLLLPIAGFFVYFFALRYNIPWFDDFENIPYFLDHFLNASSVSEAVAALLRPNNEHRVVYARLVVLGQYFLTGGLNFANLMLWGNAGLILIFYLLYRALKQQERLSQQAMVGLLPVPLLLFTAQSYIMTFTAIFSLQYLAIITLVVLTLFVLATDRPLYLWTALGLGLLSTFSMGNGLLLWPAGAVMLLIQRRWLGLGIWVVAGAISAYLYFLGYPVQQGNDEGFSYVIQHPLQTIAGFLIFAGSVFDVIPSIPEKYRFYLPFVAGLILLLGLSYWLLTTLFRSSKNKSFFEVFIVGCLLFLLANIALIAFFRLRFYFGMALHIPYRIYALALWSVASVLLYSRLSETWRVRLWPAVWLLFLGLNGFTYYTYLPEAMERRKQMQGLSFNQLHSDIGLGGTRNTELARYISNLTRMMRDRDWYHLPDPAITPSERQLIRPAGRTTALTPFRITQKPDYIIVDGNDPTYKVGLNTGSYIIMKSARYTYLVFAPKNRPLTVKPWQVSPGFSAALPVYMMQSGRYQVGLFKTQPDHSDIQFGNQYIDVP
ncbi:hypothetical protein [Spirosoma endbachense]|uniref:Glycosyltransferase RgtA/B/C/D-like domain-containing protein n=1 Tax=Spirosoma endbachense TaxID=2666025 RepID=A0A6P1VLR4_9BACT|nr:hypothetical protein [Spirosoma endbachense]QHV93625.1 hypothetical protein GJR95_00615 [Spirosoma endbachense]